MDYSGIRKSFEGHGFSTRLFETGKQVCEYLSAELQHKTIGFGGSYSLKEIGLYEALSENNTVIWHMKTPDFEVRRLANKARVYITSANAVTKTGELVNIDGTGNRVSMMAFGPELCYYIVGKNKITDNVQQAYERCKNVAAPKNARRLGYDTPCAIKGDKCYNCNKPQRICRMTLITDRVPFGMKCEVIFVDEELGF